MGASLPCEKCGKEIKEEQRYEYLGRGYCEDCYMDVLSPPKACDPWAVYAAQCSLQGKNKLSALTPLQYRIVDYVRGKGKVTAEEVTEHLHITEGEAQERIRRAATHGGPEGDEGRGQAPLHPLRRMICRPWVRRPFSPAAAGAGA